MPLQPADHTGEFPWQRFDAYLFDIDGTLLNCRDLVHYNAFHRALREVWSCERKIDMVPLHGNTDIGILRATAALGGVDDERFAAGLPRALEVLKADVERNAGEFKPELCPSIAPLVAGLQAAGKLLGVASGGIEAAGWGKLRAAGIDHHFSLGAFSWSANGENDSVRATRVEIFRHGAEQVRARLGSGAAICFVGDTPSDVAAAKALGTPVLAVATGIFSLETLRGEAPDYCVACCDGLLAAVAGTQATPRAPSGT